MKITRYHLFVIAIIIAIGSTTIYVIDGGATTAKDVPIAVWTLYILSGICFILDIILNDRLKK